MGIRISLSHALSLLNFFFESCSVGIMYGLQRVSARGAIPCRLVLFLCHMLVWALVSCGVVWEFGWLNCGPKFGCRSHICSLYPCNTFHHQGLIVSLYIPCEYSGPPGRCYDELDKFVYLQMVPLLLRLYRSPVEVFHYNSPHVVLVMQVCCGRYPELIVAGSWLVLRPANPLLL